MSLRGHSGGKNRVVVAIMIQGKMPMLKMALLVRWNMRVIAMPSHRVLFQSKIGPTDRS